MRFEWRLAPELQRQLMVFAAFVIVAAGGYWWMSAPSSTASVPMQRRVAAPTANYALVDVQGAVRRPGVFRLPADARVVDAVRAAGGLLPGHRAITNLARRVVDGEQLLIGETSSSAAEGAPSGGRIDVNSATAEQLDALPGIGPVLAQRIVDYRNAHGGFKNLRGLLDVPGIGDAKYADLASAISAT